MPYHAMARAVLCCAVLCRWVPQLTKSISDKHEEVMARMGSIMAAGILDAGARGRWRGGEGGRHRSAKHPDHCFSQAILIELQLPCEASVGD